MLSWMCYWLHQFMKNALLYSTRLYFIFMYLWELKMFNLELKLKEWLDVPLKMDTYHFCIFSFQSNCYPCIATTFMSVRTWILPRHGYEQMSLNCSLLVTTSVDLVQRTFVIAVFQIFKAQHLAHQLCLNKLSFQL